jgi:hypothetical protein
VINSILTAAGIQRRSSRFLTPPAGTYAVTFDDIETDGPDPIPGTDILQPPRIYRHDVTVELYEPDMDDEAEKALEAEINARGIAWQKQDRHWLQDRQRYQVVYTFTYYETI